MASIATRYSLCSIIRCKYRMKVLIKLQLQFQALLLLLLLLLYRPFRSACGT